MYSELRQYCICIRFYKYLVIIPSNFPFLTNCRKLFFFLCFGPVCFTDVLRGMLHKGLRSDLVQPPHSEYRDITDYDAFKRYFRLIKEDGKCNRLALFLYVWLIVSLQYLLYFFVIASTLLRFVFEVTQARAFVKL